MDSEQEPKPQVTAELLADRIARQSSLYMDRQWVVATTKLIEAYRDAVIAQAKREGAREALEKAPHERSPEERAELFSRMELLSNRLCQTQAYILDALEQVGLTIVIRALAAEPEVKP